jgi:hypothetical protein
MSDADYKRRQKHTSQQQRAPLIEVRDAPPPTPPKLKPISYLDEDLAETQLRRPRSQGAHRPSPAVPRPMLRAEQELQSSYVPPTRASMVDLDRAKLLASQPMPLRPVVPTGADQPSLLGSLLGNPWLVLLIGAVCLVIFLVASQPTKTTFSTYPGRVGISNNSPAAVVAPPVAPQTPPGEHTVIGPPTITAEDVETVLRQFGSPAVGTGQLWIDLGIQYGIDPAYALAFFIHESSAGTNPGWAGMKSGGTTTHNIGNIICAGYPTCYGRFRDYPDWKTGIEDWYKLISREYINGRSAHTVEQIVPIYAPAFENNVDAYINAVVTMVENWRQNGVSR